MMLFRFATSNVTPSYRLPLGLTEEEGSTLRRRDFLKGSPFCMERRFIYSMPSKLEIESRNETCSITSYKMSSALLKHGVHMIGTI